MTGVLRAVTRGAVVAAAGLLGLALAAGPAAAAPTTQHQARSPIKHFIYLMQGGRSFDNYFGTFPGATGLPARTCQPSVLGDPSAGCVKPFVLDGTHPTQLSATDTILVGQTDGGKMDGFVSAYTEQGRNGAAAMGYYDAKAVPFYWNVAHSYVLFDRFFSSAQAGIRNDRSYWVSARPAPSGPRGIPVAGYGSMQTIFDRLQAAGVSWKFYVQGYNPQQTYQTVSPSSPETQTSRVPLVDYWRFTHDPALSSHIVGLDQYYRDLHAGTLPAVAYVASSTGDDERSAQSMSSGQILVSAMVTALMQSHYWDSSALLVSYDGSGGWYDSVPPPTVAGTPLGVRVPALLISAYARKGRVDDTVLDSTSALKFIEQNWQVAPLATRDAQVNSIAGALNFAAAPRPAVLVPTGLNPGLDPVPAVRLTTQAQITKIYVLYGAAAAIAVLLLVFAAAWPTLAARRRTWLAGRTAAGGGAGG